LFVHRDEQHWLSVVQPSPVARHAGPVPWHAPDVQLPEQQFSSFWQGWLAWRHPPPPGPHVPPVQLFEQQSLAP
jgi:hypothetical protein